LTSEQIAPTSESLPKKVIFENRPQQRLRESALDATNEGISKGMEDKVEKINGNLGPRFDSIEDRSENQ
jgi:hypothetical protein